MQKDEKIITRRLASEIARQCRKEGRKVVFTNGCFDILHIGHLELLEAARNLGDILMVGLNSDDSVRRLKGPSRPLNNEKDRAHLLAALTVIDFIVIFKEDTPFELIKTIRPNILIKGGDYQPERIIGASFVESYGGRVVVFPLISRKSTTDLMNKLFQV